MRKLGAGELAWVIGLCLLMGSCTRPPPAGTIDAIGINEYTCLPDCHGTAIWLRRSGVASIGDNIGNTEWVTTPPGLFDHLARRLVQTPLFSSPSDLRENHRSQESASISAIVAGTFHTVSFPAPQAGVPITNDSVSQLLGFVDDVRRETAPLKNRADRAVRARLAEVAHLREVTYNAEGCYGTCQIYTVHFFADGHAVLYRRTPTQPAIRSFSTVAFSRVIELLQAANFTYLARHYGIKWTYVFGSALRLDYNAGFTFCSEGRDDTQWSPTYRDLAATNWYSTRGGRGRRTYPCVLDASQGPYAPNANQSVRLFGQARESVPWSITYTGRLPSDPSRTLDRSEFLTPRVEARQDRLNKHAGHFDPTLLLK